MEIKNKKSFHNLIKSLTEEIIEEEDLDETTAKERELVQVESDNRAKFKQDTFMRLSKHLIFHFLIIFLSQV